LQQFNYDDPRHYAFYDEQKNIICRRAYIVRPNIRIPGHPCVADNRIFSFDGFIDVDGIIRANQTGKFPVEKVSFDDIWYAVRHPSEKESEKKTERFSKADSSFPGIISPIKNPGNKKYRMLDGRRRLWKLQDQGESEAMFYVIPVPEIYRYFWMILSQKILSES